MFWIDSVESKQEKPTNGGFKAKRNVVKTWNVHQMETHPRLRINSQYSVLLYLQPFSRYLMTI